MMIAEGIQRRLYVLILVGTAVLIRAVLIAASGNFWPICIGAGLALTIGLYAMRASDKPVAFLFLAGIALGISGLIRLIVAAVHWVDPELSALGPVMVRPIYLMVSITLIAIGFWLVADRARS